MDAALTIENPSSSAAPASESELSPEPSGEVRFVAQDQFAAQVSDLRARGALVVNVGLYGAKRGSFADHAEAAVEEVLRGRGAGAQGLGSEAEPCALLSDQLFRARRLGFRGLALLIPTLKPLTTRLGAIDATDAEHVRFLYHATKDRPLVLVLPEEERCLPVFARTVPLEDHLDPLEAVEHDDDHEEAIAAEEPESPEPAPVKFEALDLDEADSDAEAEDHAISSPPSFIPDPVDAALAEVVIPSQPAVSIQPIHVISTSPPPALPPPPPSPTEDTATPDPTDGRWKSWVTALAAARGPQTLASFERLFAQSYLPLATAIDSGLHEPKARLAREEFAKNFARAYGESCPTFALTGKRPKMVLDAYDIASKMARAHGARTTHLLLVDGMRYDVAARVVGSVLENLSGRASLVDRVTIFSALPTTTSRQLETLARGPLSLGTPSETDRDEGPIRDRTAETVRRLKVGSRDVFKLDLLEARLKNAHGHAMDSLAAIEDECTAAIVKHARTLPPRTLLLVFGDHGFRFDDAGIAVQGSASPEEVILSAYGLLVGELH